MIIGIGSDLANIERIEQTIEKFGNRFLNKIFTERELLESARRKKVSKREYVSSLAKKFAAKEACSKALGTGLRQGVFWRDMEITHLKSGKPELRLTNGALKRLWVIVGKSKDYSLNVTMTDDYPWAQAFVVIESVK